MRIATYNVENLFTRAKALNMSTWEEGRPMLERYAALSALLEQAVYTDEIKAQILDHLRGLGIERTNDGRYVALRENRGKLTRRSTFGGTTVVANGRADWVGWLELKTEIINETATRNTAQVVRDVGADVIGVVEAEGRSALLQFSEVLIPAVGGLRYSEVMLVDGNDDRGIDVGLMSRNDYRIGWMRSHVDDMTDRGTRIFSRDCPEYSIWTPSGAIVWLLINHFKSKGYGGQDASNAKRWRQAEQVRQIYERLKSEKAEYVVVLGDLNDVPGSEPLAPLISGTDLKDASEHPSFTSDGRPGTYQNGTARDKIDYVLLSPALFGRMKAGGIWRKGVWGGRNGTLWEVYPEMKNASHAASDHAAVWCDVDV